jgi:outer membrane cobalamin receptor
LRNAFAWRAVFAFAASACALYAAEIKGVVIDPSQSPIPGAIVAAINRTGVITQQITDDKGQFDFNISPLYEDIQLRVAAPGFQTVTMPEGSVAIQLPLAPQSDSIRVSGSAIDVPASQSGTSVSVITSAEIRERNEAQAFDLMRELPGLFFEQGGPRGSVTDLFVRGSSSNYNLVTLNGIPINSFYYGGLVDFSQIPSDFISEIDVARGPQSAVSGSYALGSEVDFITRSPDNGPALDLLAEGGTWAERRFAGSGSALIHRWGFAASASALNDDGPVANSAYRNDNGFLSAQHRWGSQSLYAFGDFDSNEVGEPGPYGSDPLHDFTGIDLISRSKNNTSTYGAHYQNDITAKFRQDVTAGFYLNNSLYLGPYPSFNKDIRVYGDARETWSIASFWTLAGGFAFAREEMRNTYVTDADYNPYLLRRDNEGIYLENRLTLFKRFFLNIGAREEIFELAPRPGFPGSTDDKFNPKLSATYMIDPRTRLHASFGEGIRPPGGSDLAFTNNPYLKPERTESYDIGIEERFLSNKVSLDATWFHNRYKDLIVGLGGNLAVISSYLTDNVGNALSEGADVSANLRPFSWLSLRVNYMWLETSVLSLSGGIGLVQQYFYLGQPLLRQPKQNGSALANIHWKRIDANVTNYLRGRSLDVDPTYGASGGLFINPGSVVFGLNVNYRVFHNLTAYATLHNALDRHYEEIFGYPAPLLNVVAGVKWSLARAR